MPFSDWTSEFWTFLSGSIIEFLYNAGAQENADKICNIYGSRGNEFLRDIYEKYNISKSRKERNEVY